MFNTSEGLRLRGASRRDRSPSQHVSQTAKKTMRQPPRPASQHGGGCVMLQLHLRKMQNMNENKWAHVPESAFRVRLFTEQRQLLPLSSWFFLVFLLFPTRLTNFGSVKGPLRWWRWGGVWIRWGRHLELVCNWSRWFLVACCWKKDAPAKVNHKFCARWAAWLWILLLTLCEPTKGCKKRLFFIVYSSKWRWISFKVCIVWRIQ